MTGQHTGKSDIPLTPLGLDQAELAKIAALRVLGEELEAANVYSSPLSRALVTARCVVGDREIEISDHLLEFNYGDYEGLTPSQVRDKRPGWDIWRDGCPNGETPELVGKRADSFLALLDQKSVNVAFAHGHIIRILAARAVGLEARQGRIFTLDTATVSLIEDVRGIRVIKLWNLDPTILGD